MWILSTNWSIINILFIKNLNRVEHIVAKVDIALYKQFHFLSQCFRNASASGKGINIVIWYCYLICGFEGKPEYTNCFNYLCYEKAFDDIKKMSQMPHVYIVENVQINVEKLRIKIRKVRINVEKVRINVKKVRINIKNVRINVEKVRINVRKVRINVENVLEWIQTSTDARYRTKLATSSAVQKRPIFNLASKSFWAWTRSGFLSILTLKDGVSTVPVNKDDLSKVGAHAQMCHTIRN